MASRRARRIANVSLSPRGGAAGGEGRGEGGRPVLLAWALDRHGRKVRAGALRPADRRALAPFTCLGCGEMLVPHLGRVRAPHFAHAPGSRCPLTAPETALHLDAKERLLALCADAFGRRRAVAVLARCPTCRRAAPRDLAALGDAAVAEGAVGPLRADVLVLAGARAALAIEVKVTHAVDPAKEAALEAAGVPAVEVDARGEWEREEEGGTAIVCARSLGFPPCAACAARARAELERAKGGEAAEIAELEEYRARGLFGRAAPPHPDRFRSPSPRAAGRGRGEGFLLPPPTAGGEGGLLESERASLRERFCCPDCGRRDLLIGERLAKHACAGGPVRPVAWRGYDGTLVEMGWWRR